MDECIFCRIARHDASAKIEYESDEIMAIYDIQPQAPIHLLVIPKKHIETLDQLNDPTLTIKLMEAINALIKKLELEKKGYRVRINGGGLQDINHLHVWLLGDLRRS